MNRKERRALQRKGVQTPKDPTLNIKLSALGKGIMTPEMQMAMEHEINQQCLEADAKLALDVDSMVLWTLNTSQSQSKRVMHVCPLQLDIVDRLINRYSNPGELVLDPFGGLGTVALQAMKAGRKGYTIELNDGYFRDAVGYLRDYEDTTCETISMFD